VQIVAELVMRMASRFRAGGVVCVLAVLCGASPGAAQPLTGTAVIVHDGDTVSVQTTRGIVRVRLAGVDCPELAQPRGPEAKAFTARLVLGRTVRVEPDGTDQYSRVLGRLFVDGTDVNVALVRAGMAWRYQSPGNDRVLVDAERTARSAHAGIWSDPNPEPPWRWRREHDVGGDHPAASSPRRHRSAAERVSLSDARGPFHGNTRSHVFHRPGCPNYNCNSCEETFLTARSAEEAGYQPAGDCLKR
jgi:endonuclease YncB( thermonuclease family)